MSPGLWGQYYDITPANVGNSNPNFNSLTALNASLAGQTPTISALTTATSGGNFDFGSTGTDFPGKYVTGATNFESRYVGKINISTSGQYVFDTASDDGSMMWIDGNVVVNSNYFQGITTRSGTVTLTAGQHDIVIGYYQGTGGEGLYADMSSSGGTTMSRIPLSILSAAAPAYLSNTIGSLDGSGSVNLTAASLIVGSDNTNSTFSGTISGPGAWLQKIGAGTLTLTGFNAYTGGTTISAGMLSVGGFNDLGNSPLGPLGANLSGSVVLSGGTLDYSGPGETTARILDRHGRWHPGR